MRRSVTADQLQLTELQVRKAFEIKSILTVDDSDLVLHGLVLELLAIPEGRQPIILGSQGLVAERRLLLTQNIVSHCLLYLRLRERVAIRDDDR